MMSNELSLIAYILFNHISGNGFQGFSCLWVQSMTTEIFQFPLSIFAIRLYAVGKKPLVPLRWDFFYWNRPRTAQMSNVQPSNLKQGITKTQYKHLTSLKPQNLNPHRIRALKKIIGAVHFLIKFQAQYGYLHSNDLRILNTQL